MRAVRVTEFGGPEVLVTCEVPEPVAGAGQVVVRVAATGIDFVQTQLRSGFSPGPELPRLPYVPGGTLAGRVLSVGDGVDAAWVGRRVVTGSVGRQGAHAERAVAEERELIPVPDGLGFAEAPALIDDGATAVGLCEVAGVKEGEWVLVEAAGGGVGSLLVQLARAAGARVVGVARGERKLALVRELGAQAAVDYSDPGWTRRVKEITGGAGPDLAFDGVGGEIGRAAFELLPPGGRLSMHGAASGAATVIEPGEAQRRGVRVTGFEQLAGFAALSRERTVRAMELAAAGGLRPVIGQTFPLEGAAAAHAGMEGRRALGKTLLLP